MPLIGDKISLNKSATNRIGYGFIDFSIHRFTLVVKCVLLEYKTYIKSVQMKLLKFLNQIPAAKLRKHTSLNHSKINVTR